MYSGFVTSKRVVKRIGIHQRFDRAAYLMVKPYLAPHSFPNLKEILSFEGLNGPDGLKVKQPELDGPNHLYDPVSGEGEVPGQISNHYGALVQALTNRDNIRAAFEAGWLAHYITDGLTPAHHLPLDEQLTALKQSVKVPTSWRNRSFVRGTSLKETLLQNWRLWGGKGLLSTHFNFELGVAFALVLFPLRLKLDDSLVARAHQVGPVEFFRQEAAEIAKLKLYQRFCSRGWNAKIAKIVRDEVAPKAAQAVGVIWLLAYLEAGMLAVAEVDQVTELNPRFYPAG